MCFHHRLVFSCGHYIWLPKVARACAAEEAFTRGETTIGCSKMWSTGFCTMKVSQKCEGCSNKEAKSTAQIVEIKRRIGALRELVEKITSPSPNSKGKSLLQAREMTDDEKKNELREMGVIFEDDEYEARLEDFSPVSSPTTAVSGSAIFSEPENRAAPSSGRADQKQGHIPEEDPQHRPLVLAASLNRTKTASSSSRPTN